jgi:hypothetical protein
VELSLESLESRLLLTGNDPSPVVSIDPHRFFAELRAELLSPTALETAPILGFHLPVRSEIIPPAEVGNADPNPPSVSSPSPIGSTAMFGPTGPAAVVPLILSPANPPPAVEPSEGSLPWGLVVPPRASHLGGVSIASEADSTELPAALPGPRAGAPVLVAAGLPGVIQAAGAASSSVNPSVSPGTMGPFSAPWGRSGPLINLPDGPIVTVVGALNSGQTANYYHVPLDGNTGRLWFDMHAYPSMKPSDEQLAVFDEQGRMLADLVPSSGSTSVTVSVPSAHLETGDTGLVVEVASADGPSADSSSGASAPSMPREDMYVVQIARLGTSADRVAWGSGVGVSVSSSRGSAQALYPSLPPPTSAAYEEGNDLGLVNEGEPSEVVAGPVPTGPLPSRSAAPLGGVLGDGDPVPEVDRRDAVAIDLELIGLPTDALPALDVPPAVVAEAAGRLAEVRGSGGFPLLASGPVAPPLRPLAKLPALPRRWAAPSVVSAEPNPEPPRLEENEAEPSSPSSNSTSLRSSIGTGLTVALSLVFGLLLPDLAYAFERDEPPRDDEVDTP